MRDQRPIAGIFAVICLSPLAPVPAAGQDIELEAALHGRRLPQAYYDIVQRDPRAFSPRGGWIERAVASAEAGTAVSGDLPLLAVLTLFADSPDPAPDDDDLRQLLFTGPATNGTLREFYSEVSGGRLNIAGDVTPWVRTSVTLAEAVGDNFGLGGDARLGDHIVEALTDLDAGTDFGQFDNDGPDNIPNSGDDNGTVDAMAVYFLEVAASCGGAGPWPHFFGISGWTGQPFETNDSRPGGGNVQIDPYFIQSIVACSGDELTGIATVAHELGHLLGLPDLYHPVDGIQPAQRRWVIGCWSLMAAGSWGCGDVSAGPAAVRPTHPGAWEKQRLGWLDEIQEVSGSLVQVTLPLVQTSRKILQVNIGSGERLLIENRGKIGFDRDLPASGVLVYRVNDNIPFRPGPTDPRVYRVQLLEADGDSALVKTAPEGGDRGEAGDAWGAIGHGSLTNTTEPSTRHDSGMGEESEVNLFRIAVSDGVAQVLISTERMELTRLVDFLLLNGEGDLTTEERAFLDARNNGNGRYDVGDLRAYLQNGPGP